MKNITVLSSKEKMNPKVCLVTGANRGIGLEFVKQLLRLADPPKLIFAGCRNPDQAEASYT